MNDMTDGIATIERMLLGEQQTNRILLMTFPYGDGPDALMLANELVAVEGLSQDFMFTVQVLSDDATLQLKDVEGKNVTVQLVRPDGTTRYFNGIVFEFRMVGTDGSLAAYDMVLLPWLAYLRLSHDNRIFHGKSVLDQTRALLDPNVTQDHNWVAHISGEDPAMTEAVMFDDTHYNYLHDRWESRGWYYWYEHTARGHILHLSDNSPLAPPIDGDTPEVPWQAEAGSIEEDAIAGWTPVRRIVASSVRMRSFDYKNPRPQETEIQTRMVQGTVKRLERYEYTGARGFKGFDEGSRLARLRMEEIEAQAKHFEAQGNSRFLQAGRWFRMTDHFDSHAESNEDAPGEYLVLQCRHVAHNNYVQGAGRPAVYQNRATVIRKTVPWRPGRGYNSTRVKVPGPQTATVVGPPGAEIHTDRYGRIKVQFHWDREGHYDDGSSAWLRVAQAWTGKGYGFVGIPRVGQEVLVHFLDGNPDRPLVTGCLYNEDNLPGWNLPAEAHRTGIQTRSTPGGGGLCEMVIHDKAGHELINVFSQKDMAVTTLNNHSTVVQGPQQTVAVTKGTQATTVHKAISVESETEHIQMLAQTAIELLAKSQHLLFQANTTITLQVGKASIQLSADGSIAIHGVNVSITGTGQVSINQ
jgi:type VI secretion system secreted protein VgrG